MYRLDFDGDEGPPCPESPTGEHSGPECEYCGLRPMTEHELAELLAMFDAVDPITEL